MGRQVRQIAFALTLLGAGLGPLAPSFEGTPSLRLIVQMFFVLSAMLWVMAAALEGRIQLRLARLGWFLVLLVGALLAATVHAFYKFPAVLNLFSWCSAILAFVIVLNETSTPRRRLWVLLVLGASAFVVSLHGLHQLGVELPRARAMFAQNRAEVMRDLRLPPDAAFDLEGRLGKDRVFGTFLLPNSFAGFLILILPAFAGNLIEAWRRWDRSSAALPLIARTAAVLPILAALYFTKSKGAWLALLLAAAVFVLWAFNRELWRRRMQILCLLLGAVVIWCVAQFSELLPPLRDYPGSYSVRYGYWRAGTIIIETHPVFGVGLDNFADFYSVTKRPEDEEARRAHNDYLQLAAEAGLVGLAVYALFWVRFWRRVKGSEGEPFLSESSPAEPLRHFWPWIACLAAAIFLLEITCGGTLRSSPGFWGWEWVLALTAGWVIFFLPYDPAGQGAPVERGSFATIGMACGLIAFLAHSFVDFDHYVGGILQSAWIMMALLLSARTSEETQTWSVNRAIGPGLRLAAILGALALGLFVVYGFVMRVIESQALREQALDPTRVTSDDQRASELERAVRSNPLDAHNYALLSDLHLNRWVAGPPTAARDVSDLSQAVIYARKAAAVDPARAEYYMRIGRLHELRWSRTGQTQDYRDAVSAYIRAEELFPSQPEAALNLARIYDLGGRQDLALGKYRRARQLDQEQYHIPRQFTPAERAELDDRIEALSSSYTSHTEAPPPAFKQPTLLGWPRRMLTAEPDSRNRR